MPSLIKQLASGVLYTVARNPQKLIKTMISFFEGYGGIIGMLRLQATGDVPRTDPGAAADAVKDLGVIQILESKVKVI